MKKPLFLLLIFFTALNLSHAQSVTPTAADASWNRRVTGAGDYQIVLEVSGRIEIARAFQPPKIGNA